MRRIVLLVAMLGVATAVEALTVRDVIELSRSGVGEEVLLALVEVDGGVFTIDNKTLVALKQAGVPERVIVAMVRSGRERPTPEPVSVPPPVEQPRAEPQVVVIDHHDESRVREVMVPVPIYVPVVAAPGRRHRNIIIGREPIDSTYVPFQSGPPAAKPQTRKTEPVYWGFGGKLRPDAWKPDGYRPEEPRAETPKPSESSGSSGKK